MRGRSVCLAVGLAAGLLAAGPALAQFQQPAKATTGGGGESEGGGIQHFSATGVGMAVGTGAGGGVTARHGFLVGAAGRARDEEPPVIDPVPPDLRVSTARDRCEATVRFPAVRVTDNRDRIPQVTVTLLTDPPQNLDPAGDEVDLPIGSYDVIIVARDRAGNQVRETYRVDVVDEAAPIFRMVPDPTPIGGEIEAQGPAGTAVDVAFECVDACDPDPVGSVAPRLARYPVGDTELTATCRDGEGNEASEPVVIRVRDTIGPAVAAVPAPIEVECQSAQGATFQVPRVVWADNGTPANQLVQRMVLNPDGANQAFAPPPDELQLPRGVHVLRFFATDAAGNVGQTDVSVEVTDNGVPNVRVVQAPGQNGWTNADGDVQVVLEVADGCAADNGALQLDIGPPPDNIVRNGNRVTLTYSRDGIYPLAIEVTDEDGNVTRENSIAFGIDRTAPQPIFRAPGQGAVDAADEDTYPIYAQAEVLPIDFGGEDAGDGPTAGVRQVTVVYDPDGAARTLASQVFDGNGNPPRGDRLVAGIGCLNPFVVVGGVQRRDGYCNEDGELDLRYLDPGVHTIEVVVTDFAGNQGRGRAHFITADLHAGTERIIDRLTALRPIIGDALFARLVPTIQSLGRARDASDRRIAGSAFDSPVFLGSALRAAQTATNQLAAVAPQLPAGVQGELDLLQELLQRVSRSDVVLLQAHVESRPPPAVWPQYLRNAQSTDLDFADRFIGSVDDNIDAEAWSDAAGNVQSAYFHVKSALEGWVMDYHFFPNHGVPNDIQREYERGHTLLVSIAAEMDAYINEGLAGADTMRDIRRSLATVINALDILIQDGFDPDGGGMGLSDQRYVEELLELRSVANRTTLAGQNGVWVRNYQWSMMQVVRFMTQSSVEDAIFTRGGGRQIWPIYQRAHELIETGVDMLDDRRIQAVIDLYGREEDSHCLLYAVYHCDFLDDEGDADLDQPIPAADIPDYCWASMLRPVEWAGAAPVGNTPPQCLWADQVQR